MLIGLISDTHGVFSEGFRKFLEPVDEIWHAGDFGGGVETAQQIAAFKPLVGVYGNCDGQDLRFDHPHHQFFTREGMKVLMMHIGGYPGKYTPEARKLIEELRPDVFVCGHSHILKVAYDLIEELRPDVFVCGHSHILKVAYDHHYQMLTINPGACGQQGWHFVRTALRFQIDSKGVHDMEVFELPRR